MLPLYLFLSKKINNGKDLAITPRRSLSRERSTYSSSSKIAPPFNSNKRRRRHRRRRLKQKVGVALKCVSFEVKSLNMVAGWRELMPIAERP